METTKKKLKKVQTGWQIPSMAKDSFVNFCEKVGTLAQEDCGGALIVWQYLPPEIREHAKLAAKGFEDSKKLSTLVEALVDKRPAKS